MKITDRLIGDHKTFRKMLADLGVLCSVPEAADQRRLVRLAELFNDHLVIHAWFEDTFYYPAVRQGLDPTVEPHITLAYLEELEEKHRAIDGHIARLEVEVKSRPLLAGWPGTYALFHSGLQAHMKKEEDRLFPASERLLGARRLEDLALEMERRRAEAPKIRRHASGDRS